MLVEEQEEALEACFLHFLSPLSLHINSDWRKRRMRGEVHFSLNNKAIVHLMEILKLF